ncbi:MAG: hypothetical protein SGI74_05195 [Oligoflexia bacterium]|nr:hypothetical protein [Oligoflexia bacterium]
MGLGKTISRGDVCTECRFDARVCKNCEFYDALAYNECHEPAAERVIDKEKANFCDFFKPGQRASGIATKKLDPKAAADALFKKK